MTNREKAKDLFRESLKKYETNIYMVKPIHCTAAIDAIEQALSIANVVGQSEQLKCMTNRTDGNCNCGIGSCIEGGW